MPIITIARTAFSGGEKIAEEIAKRLDYPIFNRKELISKASEDFEMPETKLVETMDEPPKLWQQDRDKRDAHFNLIRATFLKLCRDKGNLVYHGFSGQELIRGVSHVLRMLVTAQEDFRIEEATRELSIEREDAYRTVYKNDNKISKWSRYMYGLEWNDPSLYDLVIQIGRISIQSAVEMILGLIQTRNFESTEASRTNFENEFLASVVWSALTKNKRTSNSHLIIMARGGRVTIAGSVRSAAMAEDITAVAEAVPGVREVVNEVSIGTIWRS
jgi:cytidylate kinase